MTPIASCSIPYEKPYGRWYSEEHGLTLDIFPDESGVYFGTYEQGDEIVDIFILFEHGSAFSIYYCDDYDFDNNEWVVASNRPFYGRFRVRGEVLSYNLTPHFQDKHGIKDPIVFQKIDE